MLNIKYSSVIYMTVFLLAIFAIYLNIFPQEGGFTKHFFSGVLSFFVGLLSFVVAFVGSHYGIKLTISRLSKKYTNLCSFEIPSPPFVLTTIASLLVVGIVSLVSTTQNYAFIVALPFVWGMAEFVMDRKLKKISDAKFINNRR